MIILSGGTGTPKLLVGLKRVFGEAQLKIIVNTAEDVWLSGNLVCPDIDSVIYTLAGIIDDEKWWGIKDDSFHTHEMVKLLGCKELLQIGDKDRATHIVRTELLRRGKSLTEATSFISKALGIKAKILPMSDEPTSVRTKIVTSGGKMHFQEFWVGKKGKGEVRDVIFEGIEDAKPSKEVMKVLGDEKEKFVIIGPSNPITSIGPILGLKGVRERIRRKKVIAISPIIGNKPVSGPAAEFMRAKGFEVSSYGVLKCYEDLLDVFVIDKGDNIKNVKIKIYETDIMIGDVESSVRLAAFLKEIIEKYEA
ncbi:MAG: 2-phospho-L-lactate transferase [Candidatus Methanospirareceae archaeon]